MSGRTDAEFAELERDVATLRRMLADRDAALAESKGAYAERIEHQAATIDVLKVMSASPGEAQPVFDLIVRRAAEVCGAPNAVLFRYEGGLLHWRATSGAEVFASRAAFESLQRQFPMAPSRASAIGQTLLDRRVTHVRDIDADPDLYQPLRDIGMKSLLGIPLLRDGEPLGVIGLSAREPGGFSDAQVALLETFAEQAVIAIGSAETYRALQESTAALAQRNSEYGERIEHQSATIDVLKVMAASPGDPQPVFDLISVRARDICGAYGVTVCEFDGSLLHWRAATGVSEDPAVREAARASFPRPPARDWIHGRAILDRDIVHIRDTVGDPELARSAVWETVRSNVTVPMMRGGVPIGTLAMGSREKGGFSDTQVELLKTFAEQAVIAIGSAETFRTLQERTAALAQRNSEYGERIEQQAATIDVLKAMSASPGDPQPVFDLITQRARSFCGADMSAIALAIDGSLQLQSHVGFSSETAAAYEAYFPRPVGPDTLFGRTILSGVAVQIPDNTQDPGYAMQTIAREQGARSHAGVPLLRAGVPAGALVIARQKPGEFSATQIELLQTFAEQAVIAIGGAETWRALQERTAALAQRNSEFGERIEQQAATIDVLKVMSSTPDDVQPVFDQIVRRAAELCSGEAAALFEFDGELVRLSSWFWSERNEAALATYVKLYPRPPLRDSIISRAILDMRIIHIRDYDIETDGIPEARALGSRSRLILPLVRDGKAIGAIALNAKEPGGFTDSQVALLQTFAEQAVIAIGSAETYRALRDRTGALAQRNSEFGERIEQQAATIDVLKVMSSTPDDTQPVFEQIVRRATELCNGVGTGLFEFDGEMVHFRTIYDAQALDPAAYAAYAAAFPMRPSRGSISCRAILDKQMVHIRDTDADLELSQVVRELLRADRRSQISIPLMRDGAAIGCISLGAAEPGGFTDSQIALLQTFAEQAVIAITSVANFRALRERTDALTRSVAELQALEEVLRAVNSSLDLNTVLETIISRAVRLSQADEGTIYEFNEAEEVFVPRSAYGMTEARVAVLRDRRIRIGETPLGISAATRAPQHIADLTQTSDDTGAPELVRDGIHALLAVPLLREDNVVGGLVIRRRTAGGFPPTTVALMQTFAAQSVLAIENARLYQEAGRARAAAETALADLRRTQDRLVQTEKMASLGQLTAGIAHEIKNPLNFVNNFSDLSVDLLAELNAAVAPGKLAAAGDLRTEIDDIVTTLQSNLEKIAYHGRRADNIVKSMLLHSRTGPTEHRPVDLNAVVEEALNLAYHGARAETPGFSITMENDLDPAAGTVDLFPQEFTRVMVNVINNGFHAAHKRARQAGESRFEPAIRVTTRDLGDQVEVRVRDNGTGIPADIRDKLFEPFFTTKPAGEGTGLGLSIAYDIVTKQHGGTISVDSEVDAFTEFSITLPRGSRMTADA